MSFRPGSGAGGRPGSRGNVPSTASRPPAGAVPPGTASRLTTSRAGTSGASGVAISSEIQVQDRPMSRQGLGLKTAGQGPQRQVQDKTFWLGRLRAKVNELSAETERLRKEKTQLEDDQQNYVSYEKRAETLATELKRLQDDQADYNTLVDKLNTDESIIDMQMECNELKSHNDHETAAIDQLFEQRKELEREHLLAQKEYEQISGLSEAMVADMNPKMRQQYYELRDQNEHLLQQIEHDRHELDSLELKKVQLEEELQASPFKQEAVRLHETLHEMEEKRDQLLLELKENKSPQEEREELLAAVKRDNQEIASMERQMKELQEQREKLEEDLNQLNMDLEENHGERNQKFRELKKREETFEEFLNTFEDNKRQEQERISQKEQTVVTILEHTSRNLARFHHLPTSAELTNMKDDLQFKESEMKKSEYTASGLAGETAKLQEDLLKVEQLETKITEEYEQLQTQIATMEQELDQYHDTDKLRQDAEDKKKKLQEDKVILHKRKEAFRKSIQALAHQYEAAKSKLNENETYSQLANLEKKWQHVEQNNFVMKEFIASKSAESNFRQTAKSVMSMISDYNKVLQDQAAGKSAYYP